jgi:hypothetical protein
MTTTLIAHKRLDKIRARRLRRWSWMLPSLKIGDEDPV